METKKQAGGSREGAGRKPTGKKLYPVWCHPNRIKEVREFAKRVSIEEAEKLKQTQ